VAHCDCSQLPDGFRECQAGLRFPARQAVPGFPEDLRRPGDFQHLLPRGLRHLSYHAGRAAIAVLEREALPASFSLAAARPVWPCPALAADDLQPPAVWLQPPRELSPALAAGPAQVARVLSRYPQQVEYCGPLHELRAPKRFASRPREQCCFALAVHLRMCHDSPRSRC